MTAIGNDTNAMAQRKTLAERAYEFIWERDPFGDHFSQHDMETIRDSAIPVVANPCAKILDHKWLDPNCVENGCQSLANRALPSADDLRRAMCLVKPSDCVCVQKGFVQDFSTCRITNKQVLAVLALSPRDTDQPTLPMAGLPTIPDEDADFTPDLARKIIGKYQEIIARYGLHTWDCDFNDSRGERPCNCGWATIEARVTSGMHMHGEEK